MVAKEGEEALGGEGVASRTYRGSVGGKQIDKAPWLAGRQ